MLTCEAEADAGFASEWRPGRRRWTLGRTLLPVVRRCENECLFREVDRHVLAGNGAKAAFIFEGDRWDPSRNGGRGGPVQQQTITYRELLLQTALRAQVLVDLASGKATELPSTFPISRSSCST